MARTIVKTIEVFNVKELTGVNYRNALEATARQASEDWHEWQSEELLASMNKAARHFGMRVVDWSIGLFDRSYVRIDTELFDEEQADHAVEWITGNYKDGADGSCPFTGVYYDCYFFDYFVENGLPTVETVKEDIVQAIVHMLEKAIADAESDLVSDDYMLSYIETQQLEFTADGEIFHG